MSRCSVSVSGSCLSCCMQPCAVLCWCVLSGVCAVDVRVLVQWLCGTELSSLPAAHISMRLVTDDRYVSMYGSGQSIVGSSVVASAACWTRQRTAHPPCLLRGLLLFSHTFHPPIQLTSCSTHCAPVSPQQ